MVFSPRKTTFLLNSGPTSNFPHVQVLKGNNAFRSPPKNHHGNFSSMIKANPHHPSWRRWWWWIFGWAQDPGGLNRLTRCLIMVLWPKRRFFWLPQRRCWYMFLMYSRHILCDEREQCVWFVNWNGSPSGTLRSFPFSSEQLSSEQLLKNTKPWKREFTSG